jgi:putative tricarboxylic transport membrane protein
MGQANQISSIFWLILGSAVSYGSYRLGLGTLTHPGPGFLPFWCGTILAGLSALVFFQGTLAKRRGDQIPLGRKWKGMRWSKTVFVVLAILVYIFTFTYLGFLLSTTLLLIFLLKAVDPERWMVAVGTAIFASLASFVVFALWLDVQLPRGFLERMLF